MRCEAKGKETMYQSIHLLVLDASHRGLISVNVFIQMQELPFCSPGLNLIRKSMRSHQEVELVEPFPNGDAQDTCGNHVPKSHRTIEKEELSDLREAFILRTRAPPR